MTRIVAGTVGGRQLEVPSRGTRPTSERVREALFSALEAAVDIDGTRVLDLYAGSGALGLEALSRGAAHAMFVESHRAAVSVLRRNIATLGFGARASVRPRAVSAVLAETADTPFGVVLVDPPYAVSNSTLGEVLAALADGAWVRQDSVLVLERSARDGDPSWPVTWSPGRTRRYGDTVLHWAVREDG